MTAAFSLAILIAAAGGVAPEQAAPARIQIAIVRQAVSAAITPEGEVRVVLPSGKTTPLEWKGEMRLTPRDGGVRLSQLKLPTETRLVPQSGAVIKVGSDRHRGTLILRLDPGQTVTIVE
ncbi:MAG: hypothetical protein ACHQ2Z_14235, partial [Elusimicrobiota bacterium]